MIDAVLSVIRGIARAVYVAARAVYVAARALVTRPRGLAALGVTVLIAWLLAPLTTDISNRALLVLFGVVGALIGGAFIAHGILDDRRSARLLDQEHAAATASEYAVPAWVQEHR